MDRDQRRALAAERRAARAAEHQATTHPFRIEDPRDPRLGEPFLPEKFHTFRAHQIDAIEQIMEAFQRVEVVVVDAPPGSGKSVLAEVIGRLVTPQPRLYVCTTKSLQDQVTRDFPYYKVLKGRSNYTPHHGWEAQDLFATDTGERVTCADCTATADNPDCRLCEERFTCPYQVAKREAAGAKVAVLNTSYLLADGSGPATFQGREFAVLDEADVLEGVLMGHVEVTVSKARQKRYGINPPTKRTVEESWRDWVWEEALPKIKSAIGKLPPPEHAGDAATAREAKGLRELAGRLEELGKGIDEGGWIYTGYRAKSDERHDITFKPVEVSKWGKLLWSSANKILVMSGTVISAGQMMDELGCTKTWDVVTVPMTFPVENRPIRVGRVASMTYKNKDEATPKIVEAVEAIVRRHEGERVLVHSVSYELTNKILNGLLDVQREGRNVVSYTNGRQRDGALEKYLAEEGSVLVAPSMDRGVDLPGDACRVQVITKVPYPSLGDQQVSARLHSPGGQSWFNVGTVRTLVQMVGRAVRSEDDYAVCYVLDSNFTERVWGRNKRLFPKWFREATDFRWWRREMR